MTRYPWQFGLVSYMAYPELVYGSSQEVFTILEKLRLHNQFQVYEFPVRPDLPLVDLLPLIEDRTILVGTQTNSIKEQWDLCASSPNERIKAQNELLRAIEFASTINASYVALWSGRRDNSSSEYDQMMYLHEVVNNASELAKQANIRLVIEAFPRCAIPDALIYDEDQLVELCQALHQQLGIMFDAAHHALENKQLPPRNEIAALADVIQLGTGWRGKDGVLEDRHPDFSDQEAITSFPDMINLLNWAHDHSFQGIVTFELRPDQQRTGDDVALLLTQYINTLTTS